MSKPDKQVVIILIIVIVIYLAVAIAGFVFNRLSFLCCILNFLTGLSVILYWLQKQIGIAQHIIESREMVVLFLETLVCVCAVYLLVTQQWNHWLRIIQYAFAAIHFVILTGLLVFMLSFKIKKMF